NKWARPAKSGTLKWSPARTLVPASKALAGNVLVHMQAGDAGRLVAEYWRGQKRKGVEPVWHMYASMTTNGLSAKPRVIETRISKVPTDTGTASELMGACTSGNPLSGVVNGLACGRSRDGWGVAENPSVRAQRARPDGRRPDTPRPPARPRLQEREPDPRRRASGPGARKRREDAWPGRWVQLPVPEQAGRPPDRLPQLQPPDPREGEGQAPLEDHVRVPGD